MTSVKKVVLVLLSVRLFEVNCRKPRDDEVSHLTGSHGVDFLFPPFHCLTLPFLALSPRRNQFHGPLSLLVRVHVSFSSHPQRVSLKSCCCWHFTAPAAAVALRYVVRGTTILLPLLASFFSPRTEREAAKIGKPSYRTMTTMTMTTTITTT